MISVALATFNGERFVEKQLKSILHQTLPVDEVVICDDRSTDNTVEICRRFIEDNGLDNAGHIFQNENNIGFCLNFYEAIERCHGDYIFICDQDDEWLPEKVKIMVDTMKFHPEIMVLSSRYDVINENSEIIKSSGVTYLSDKNDGSLEYLTADSFIGCSYVRGFSLCISSEIKPYIKKIDLKSLLAHDWLLCMLGCCYGKTAILNKRLVHYRYHLDNVSLSAMNKKNRVRDIKKRISGIAQSIEGHKYILSIILDEKTSKTIERFIAFEKKRLDFLTFKKFSVYLSLLGKLKYYNRYYKGKGFRVYIGDFLYAYSSGRRLK